MRCSALATCTAAKAPDTFESFANIANVCAHGFLRDAEIASDFLRALASTEAHKDLLLASCYELTSEFMGIAGSGDGNGSDDVSGYLLKSDELDLQECSAVDQIGASSVKETSDILKQLLFPGCVEE